MPRSAVRHRFRLALATCACLAALSAVAFGVLPQQQGTVDLLTQANVTIDGALPGEQSGNSVASAGDVNGDGLADVIVGAPMASPSSRADAGSSYVIYGQASPADVHLSSLGSRGFRIDGAAASDQSGNSVASAGDVNGDGFADVIVGAPGARPSSRSGAGSTYVVFGQASSTDVNLASLGSRGFRIDGAASGDRSGWSVASAGDVNGDGRPDVIIGARDASPSSRNGAGSSFVVYGQASPSNVDLASLGSRGFRVNGAASNNRSGTSVASAGDVNGDGRADVIVGAPFVAPGSPSRSQAGSSYVIYGQASQTYVDLALPLGSGGFRIDGAASANRSGNSVASAGDVNGDGLADVIVGASNASPSSSAGAGSSYVIYGQASPADVDLASVGSRGFRIDGAAAYDQSGTSVASAGDINGDGHADVIVGAPYASPGSPSRSQAGSSYVIYGEASQSNVDLASLGSRGFSIDGAAMDDNSGIAVAAAGDINGDGRTDVIVGANGANTPTAAGASYVVYGFGPASVSYPGAITGTVGSPIAPLTPTVRRTGTATFGVSPALPTGLAIDTASGVISGTPTQAASGTYTVTMADLSGTTSTTAPITVSAAAQPPQNTPLAGPSAATSASTPTSKGRTRRAGSVALTRDQARTGISVTSTGRASIVLSCPAGGTACRMSGALTSTRRAMRGAAEAAAAPVVLARVPTTTVKAGATKVVTIRIRPAQFTRIQAAGITRMSARLTLRTALVATGSVKATRVVLKIPPAQRPLVTG